MRNQIPGIAAITDESERTRYDINSRPDEVTHTVSHRVPRQSGLLSLWQPTDYATVPIEQFGEAMLRGMGWKPGEAIGVTNKGYVSRVLVHACP